MANTGYKIQPQLKKVTDDVNEYPLDANNMLVSETGLPQDLMANPIDSPTYRILSDDCAVTPIPVTVNYNITRDNTPYVEGNLGLRKNGGTEELFTFIGTGTSSLGFNIGDSMTVHTFHYHLGARWPDDASLTVNIRQGGIGGTIIYTYTGGAVSSADVDIHTLSLSATEYTIQVTTNSNDTTLLTPGYELINNTAIGDGLIKISVIDTTTGLTMLGEPPSESNVPVTGFPRTGAYNVKNDSNPQTIVVNNTSSETINVVLTTVPEGGVYTNSFDLAAGVSVNKTGVDKVGFRLTVNSIELP